MGVFDMPASGPKIPTMPGVIDLSKLTTIDKESMIVVGLTDGARVVGQIISQTDKEIVLMQPLRMIMRPVGDGRVALDLIDFVIGAEDNEGVALRQSAIVLTYTPEESLTQGYADHLASNK